MNAADLARLELAKRAFRATEPNATEVQRGVRRARLALQRPKTRRRWFSKGAVMLVLAVGGLAYAKPQALNDFVARTLVEGASSKHGAARAPAAAVLAPQHEPAISAPGPQPRGPGPGMELPKPEPAPVAQSAKAVGERPRSVAQVKAPSEPHGVDAPGAAREAASAQAAAGSASSHVSGGAATTSPTTANAVSDWGRVAQALAQGDEGKALSALSALSESGDQRTRDKADIGRAQLFMANGDHEGACALARDLIGRHAGGRIDRQAQAILKSCPR
jgi:hypothetical protein